MVDTKAVARTLVAWFARHQRALPWRKTTDPYAIWVSEVMLQQTQVKTVLPYWERWMRALPTIAALAKADLPRLHKLWEGLGYYRRVDNMRQAAQMIVTQHGGEFPRTFEAVLALPGVGRYTAGAICSIAFKQPTPILDGNVIRVLARIFGIPGDPRRSRTSAKLWVLAEELVRSAAELGRKGQGCSALNQSLMELGALVCTPGQPQCAACPLSSSCTAHRLGLEEKLPGRTPRARAAERRFVAIAVQHGNRFLVRRRPDGIVNAGLWEFPNMEVTGPGRERELARELLGADPTSLERLCTIKHTITRYRITLEVFRAREFTPPPDGAVSGRWLSLAAMKRLAFPSAHRRVVDALQRPPRSREQKGPTSEQTSRIESV